MNSKIIENNISELEAQINALKFKNSELEVNVEELKTSNQSWLCCMNNRPMTKSSKMLLCSSDKLTSIIYAFSKEKTI